MYDSARLKRLRRSPRRRLLAAAALSSAVLAAATTCTSPGSAAATVSQSSTTTTTPKGSPAQLLVEWANCMRRHGDPNQADPSITANKVIDIPWNGAAIPGGPGGTNQGGHGNLGPGQYCRAYLAAAEAALRGGRSLQRPSRAGLLKLSECMRANGFPEFPDPGANGGPILPAGPGTYVDSPRFQTASEVCARRTGVSWGGGGAAGTITISAA